MLGGGRKSEVTIQDMRAQLEGHILSGDEEQALTNQNDDDTASASTQNSMRAFKNYSSKILVVLILVLGLLTSGAFLGIGISGAIDQIKDDFNRRALDTTNQIVDAFEDYVTAASLIHSRCRHNFTRADFRELYEYLIASGLKFKAVQFDPNITHDERAAAETEAREYYNKTYPHVNYQGIRGFNTDESKTLEPRTNQTFYFPIHYMEPIYGNEAAIDLDYYSSEPRTRAVNAVFENKGPSLTDRLSLVKQGSQQSRCGVSNVASYGVVLMHPGVNLTTQPDVWPKDFASIVLCIPDLLKRSIVNEGKNTDIFIHDVSDPNTNGEPVFLVAASVKTTTNGTLLIDFIEEEPFVSLADAALTHRQRIKAANREWMITCVDTEGIWDNSMLFIILGGVIILQASVALAFWVQNSDRKTKRFNEMRQRSENEKAALILSNARQATKTERELNDFIAHEVRNPVAAAMVATNFIQTEINKPEPLADKDSMTQTREDLNIIANALKFINDLLRNMLDMHRAASKQLQVNMVPTNVLHDILEPVRGMLHRRGNKIKMIVDCPENIWIMADPLRLKQVVLNLGRNSSKFVDEGFIRLQAEEVDNNVKLYVDDSGSGIPPEKCDRLFTKFQESLDLLSQGTGIGLYLCKSLVDLMGGKIYLENDYYSGIEGHPGTRFVIDMQASSVAAPAVPASLSDKSNNNTGKTIGMDNGEVSLPFELPSKLNILFVDDDSILRKLFKRSVKRVAPEWNVREASNGETALILTDTEDFDIIFVDMYMASVEKQLLGSETIAALRNKGVKCRLCGLSANDKEEDFFEAGADAFMFKPFPCIPYELTQAMCRILYQSGRGLGREDTKERFLVLA